METLMNIKRWSKWIIVPKFWIDSLNWTVWTEPCKWIITHIQQIFHISHPALVFAWIIVQYLSDMFCVKRCRTHGHRRVRVKAVHSNPVISVMDPCGFLGNASIRNIKAEQQRGRGESPPFHFPLKSLYSASPSHNVNNHLRKVQKILAGLHFPAVVYSKTIVIWELQCSRQELF